MFSLCMYFTCLYVLCAIGTLHLCMPLSLCTLYITNNLVIALLWGLIEEIVKFNILGGLFLVINLLSFVKH